MAKTEEFKATIASVLGVKLTFCPNGQVRVTSTYDLSTAFTFQPSASVGEGGVRERGVRMQLVEQTGDGPEELPQLVRYWVEQEGCIPGFLASITLAGYERRKMEEERGV